MAIASQALKYNYVYIQSQNTGGKPIDLTRHLEYIEYFENILSPTITMNMKIRSSYNFVSDLPIRGGEMISMEIETAFGKIKFGRTTKNEGIIPGSGELYVYKMENFDQPSQAQSFTLKITSLEYFVNETTRCMKRYKPANVHTHVRDILEKSMKVRKDRIGTIEETKNTYSFIGNNKKPFYTIQWLCPKSITGEKKKGVSGEGEKAKAVGTAGYFFYETQDGFQFRSIEGLVSKTRGYDKSSDLKEQGIDIHGPYTYQGTGSIGNLYKLEENFKINYFHINRGSDIRKALSVGQFSNKTIFFNSLTHAVSQYDYKLFEQVENKLGNENDADGSKLPVPLINIEAGVLAGLGTDKQLKNLTSRYMFKMSDHGTLGIGTDGFQTSGIDEADQAKSISRYNALFSQSVDIQVPCNTTLKVGDLINCVFPELKDGQSSEKDAKASGNYLIVRLNHHFQTNSSYTSLNLVRDSYGYAKVGSSQNQKKAYESNREKQIRLRRSQFK